MAIHRSYLSKNNTIIQDSMVNTALNPVWELVRGKNQFTGLPSVNRYIFDLDLDVLQQRVDDKEITEDNIRYHRLRFTNSLKLRQELAGKTYGQSGVKRDSGFELILFRVPEYFDEGSGYDFYYDNNIPVLKRNVRPSNWRERSAGKDWQVPGIYDESHPVEIIGTGYLERGDEDLDFDVTAEINSRLFSPASGQTSASVEKEQFPEVYGETLKLNLAANHILSLTANGVDLRINVDYTYQQDTITFAEPLEGDLVTVTYLPVTCSPLLMPHLFASVQLVGDRNKQYYPLPSPATHVLAVELNGQDLAVNLDYSTDGQGVKLTEAIDEYDRLVVKYLKENNTDPRDGALYKGYGIAYSPRDEALDRTGRYAVSFFSRHTNTFFEPYLETGYDDTIKDDRTYFLPDVDNRLYYYNRVRGKLTNLDRMPGPVVIRDCSGEETYRITPEDVRQQGVGVYYIDLHLSSQEYSTDRIWEDEWQGLEREGRSLEPTVQEFHLRRPKDYFGHALLQENNIHLMLSGLHQDEVIVRGAVKMLQVHLRELQPSGLLDEAKIYYRTFVRQGENHITVHPKTYMSRGDGFHFCRLDTQWMLPQKYYLELFIEHDSIIFKHKTTINFNIKQQ